ncbi:MAG: hypothetical protein IJ629_01805 [Clostridia bacterium]|nr:hypothetical protein [Clostridia bacterium]
MFIYNIQFGKKRLGKIVIILFSTICLILLAISISKILGEIKEEKQKELVKDDFSIPSPDIAELTSENYCNILKEVHEDLNTYIGQKITFTGYVYRVADLKENQFILARDMIINSKNQSVVVGFLCEYGKAKELINDSWVKITGTITKGNYYGEIPIIKIDTLEETSIPNNPFVTPPSDSYVPTSIIY